ncbi:MAG: hypothetical protein QF886_21985, partial [Planctomycetota bacterium]|nr:hypothetical protein [Planctomycetota bacterium]
PIAYCLAYPDRLPLSLPKLQLEALGRLDFAPADLQRFPCLDLAMQAEATQGAAIKMLDSGNKAKSLVQQKLSYRILKEIEELMPRPPPQQSQQEQQEQESQQEQEPEEQERQDAQEQEPEEAQDMPPEQEQEPEAQEPAAEQEEGEEEALSEEDVKRLLDRALQREREHEAEKRKRRDSRPLSPMDRDW